MSLFYFLYSLVFLSAAYPYQKESMFSLSSCGQRQTTLADPQHVFIRGSDYKLHILDCITGEEKAQIAPPQPFESWDLTLDKRYLYFLRSQFNSIWFFDLIEWQGKEKEIPLEEEVGEINILMHQHFLSAAISTLDFSFMHVINLLTFKKVATYQLPEDYSIKSITTNGKYFLAFAEEDLIIFDPINGKKMCEDIKCESTHLFAYSKDKNYAFVGKEEGEKLHCINLNTFKKDKSIPLYKGMKEVIVTKEGSAALVTYTFLPFVTLIDLVRFEKKTEIELLEKPGSFHFSYFEPYYLLSSKIKSTLGRLNFHTAKAEPILTHPFTLYTRDGKTLFMYFTNLQKTFSFCSLTPLSDILKPTICFQNPLKYFSTIEAIAEQQISPKWVSAASSFTHHGVIWFPKYIEAETESQKLLLFDSEWGTIKPLDLPYQVEEGRFLPPLPCHFRVSYQKKLFQLLCRKQWGDLKIKVQKGNK